MRQFTRSRITVDGQQNTQNYPTWNPSRYEDAVIFQLRKIYRSFTGSLVIDSLRHAVTVIPFHDPTTLNASAGASQVPGLTDEQRRFWGRRHTQRGAWVNHTTRDRIGLGSGASTWVHYTPGMFIRGNNVFHADLAGFAQIPAGMRADEALLHELVHAMRQTMGLNSRRPLTGNLAGYGRRSEYNAILVANIYASENSRPIRDGHNGPAQNGPAQADHASPTSREFLSQGDNYILISELSSEMPDFTRELARAPAAFNPFRDYYRNLEGLEDITVN